MKEQIQSLYSAYQTELFGSRVLIFDDSMDQQEIQKIKDAIHRQQEKGEFSRERIALLFKPGRYYLDITVDYYVQALGLGRVPGDVQIQGRIQSTAATEDRNVTLMFWPAAENFSIYPGKTSEPLIWAVSQAAPLRRIHLHGDIVFDQGGAAGDSLQIQLSKVKREPEPATHGSHDGNSCSGGRG